MVIQSSHDLLLWLVEVWESGSPRAGRLAQGGWLVELAVAEGVIEDGPIGLMDGLAYWCEELRAAGWIIYDDNEAVKVRMPGTLDRSRNDIILSRNFAVTPGGVSSVKSSQTATSVGRVAVDLADLKAHLARMIDETDAPEETKQEARRLLRRVGDATLSDAAAELLVKVAFALARGAH